MALVFRRRLSRDTADLDQVFRPVNSAELLGRSLDDPLTCSFCLHHAASGYWLTPDGDVLCCRGCAKETLAGLFADSVLGEHASTIDATKAIEAALKEFTAAVWRAAMLAVQSSKKRSEELRLATQGEKLGVKR